MVAVVVVEFVSAPLVPVIVIVEDPRGVPTPAVKVSVVVPLPLIVAGEKLPEAPVGSPVMDKATVPVNPLIAPMVTKYVPEPACHKV